MNELLLLLLNVNYCFIYVIVAYFTLSVAEHASHLLPGTHEYFIEGKETGMERK